MDGIQSPAPETGAATASGLCATGGLAWVVAAALAKQGQPLTDRQFCAVLRQSEALLAGADAALLAGVRWAQLGAFDRLLQDFGKPHPEAKGFIRRARRVIAAAGRGAGAAPAPQLTAAATQTLQRILAPAAHDDPAARRQAVAAQQIETAVLRELAEGFQDKLPEDWEARFPPGFNGQFRAGFDDRLPRWFEWFGALLIRRGRTDAGFRAALDQLAPQLLANLPASPVSLFDPLAARFGGTEAQLPAPGHWHRPAAIAAGIAGLGIASWLAAGLLRGHAETALDAMLGDRIPYACDIKEWTRRNVGRAPVPDAERVTVLVPHLAGDPEGRVTARIGAAFAGLSGFSALTTCRGIPANASAEAVGALLTERQANLLVAGEAEAPGVYRVAFRGPGEPVADGRAPIHLAGPLLEPALQGELASGLQAAALAALPRGDSARVRAVLPLMRSRLQALEKLLVVPPPGFDATTRRDLVGPTTRALQTLAEQTDDQPGLLRAVDQWRWLLGRMDRRQTPLAWGAAQTELGKALLTLGEWEFKPERYSQALAAFRAALESIPRDTAPLDWAVAQMGLGAALVASAQQDPGPAPLREAVGAYRAALGVLPRALLPELWGEAEIGFAEALRALGEREPGTARLEHAVAVARSALEALPRDSVPLDWARAQNGLGLALGQLGLREGGTALLEEAAAAFRAALQAWPANRQRFGWAMVQNNLGNVLIGLAEQETGTSRLEQAASAYRAALDVIRRELAPQAWAGTQNNLGTALWLLGERDKRPQLQEEAVVAFEAALTERTPDRVPLFAASSRYNLAMVRESLAAQSNRRIEIERALVDAEAALGLFQKAGMGPQVAMVTALRDRLRQKLAN
jgi:tetratricopeptide (TPR) repeat protein